MCADRHRGFVLGKTEDCFVLAQGLRFYCCFVVLSVHECVCIWMCGCVSLGYPREGEMEHVMDRLAGCLTHTSSRCAFTCVMEGVVRSTN